MTQPLLRLPFLLDGVPFHEEFGWRDHEQPGGRAAVKGFPDDRNPSPSPLDCDLVRPWGKTAWRGCSWVLDSQKLWERIHDYYCFRPLSFGVICYTAVKTTETAGDREVRRASEGSCLSSCGPCVPGSRSWFWPLCFVPASPRTTAPASTHSRGRTSSGQTPPPKSTRPQGSLFSLSLRDILNFNYIPSHSLPHYSGFLDIAWGFVHEDRGTTAQCMLVHSLPGKDGNWASWVSCCSQGLFIAGQGLCPFLLPPSLLQAPHLLSVVPLSWNCGPVPSPNHFVTKGMTTFYIPMCIYITHFTVQTLTHGRYSTNVWWVEHIPNCQQLPFNCLNYDWEPDFFNTWFRWQL